MSSSSVQSYLPPVYEVGVRLFARRTFTTKKFGHLPPPNSDISPPPKKKTFARRTTATPNFFDLQLMEDIKDGKEEVLDEVVMEYIM